MRLDRYRKVPGLAGRGFFVQVLWWWGGALLSSGVLPGSGWRRVLLRIFGARIGEGVVIKPGIKIKWPWKLVVGDWAWIGEGVWIDNLDVVEIGPHSCVSQGAYLCTGNHDWSDEIFALRTAPIRIGEQCWVGARATVGPGCEFGEGCVLTMGSTGGGKLAAWSIYSGVPAVLRGARKR